MGRLHDGRPDASAEVSETSLSPSRLAPVPPRSSFGSALEDPAREQLPNLAHLREGAGLTQDDLATALGVSRVMVSYWEKERRSPSDAQLATILRLTRSAHDRFGVDSSADVHDPSAMFFRRASMELTPQAQDGIREFLGFLDFYANLARRVGRPVQGMSQSPFVSRPGTAMDTAEDGRRKAEEVRAHLRLGLGPVADLDWVAQLLRVTIHRVRLGADLNSTISGAFYRHPEIGFCILVNLDMSVGRRRFTIAHELAHALLHSSEDGIVVSGGRRDQREKFADLFAGEFLMPAEGIRRAMEEQGVGNRIENAPQVVQLQRFFRVSYITALVRLRQARLLTKSRFDELKSVRPVHLAEQLGYSVGREEYGEYDESRWSLGRYPFGFLTVLRDALAEGVLSATSAAEALGVTEYDIEALLEQQHTELSDADEAELREFETSGVVAI